MKESLGALLRVGKITGIYLILFVFMVICTFVYRGTIVFGGLISFILGIVIFLTAIAIKKERLWRMYHVFMNACFSFSALFTMLLFSSSDVEAGSPGEAALYFLLTIMFLGIAVLATIIGGTLSFLGENKFKILITSIIGIVGYKLLQNKDQGDNIIDAKVVKDNSIRDGINKLKDLKKYLD